MIETFFKPESVIQARLLKERFGDKAVYYAGGTKLNATPTKTNKPVAIFLCNLGFNDIEANGRELRIGATVTLQQLRDHALTPEPLKQAAGFVYSRHLRNQSTLGGEVAAHQDEHPLLPTLIAMQARLELFDRVELPEREQVSVEEYLAEGRDALITAVIIPDCSIICAQQRVARSAGGLAVLTAAVSLPKQSSQPIMAIDGLSHQPLRLRDVEGRQLEGKALEEAVREAVQPKDDIRGSAQYKQYLAGVIVADLLVQCQQQRESN